MNQPKTQDTKCNSNRRSNNHKTQQVLSTVPTIKKAKTQSTAHRKLSIVTITAENTQPSLNGTVMTLVRITDLARTAQPT